MTVITNWGLIGPTTNGIKWLGSPEAVAKAWHEGTYPNAVLRLARDGVLCFGTLEESAVVYEALNALREGVAS